ncbi:MAG: DUF6089 family protein [Flavobacteriales bacterium]
MKRLLLVLVLIASLSSQAQYNWDYGVKIGAANYLGDIGGKELTRRDFVWDMHLLSTRYAAGIYGRYKFSKRLAVAANSDFIRITDKDALTTNPARRGRNMNFRNNIIELGVRAELTVWYDNDVGNKGYYNPDFKLYLFGGVSGYYHNPQGQIYKEGELQYGGYWFDLRPWKTEGQEKAYSAFGVAIPAGLGMYFTFNKEWRVGWEFSWRTTFTDYLDDISTLYNLPNSEDEKAFEFYSQTYQGLVDEINASSGADGQKVSVNDFRYYDENQRSKRGDATNNDSYLTAQFTVGKVIRGRSNFYKSKYSYLKNRAGVRRSKAKF